VTNECLDDGWVECGTTPPSKHVQGSVVAAHSVGDHSLRRYLSAAGWQYHLVTGQPMWRSLAIPPLEDLIERLLDSGRETETPRHGGGHLTVRRLEISIQSRASSQHSGEDMHPPHGWKIPRKPKQQESQCLPLVGKVDCRSSCPSGIVVSAKVRGLFMGVGGTAHVL
jgi:hypothetical protein